MSTRLHFPIKDPADVTDHEFNFVDWLVEGDAITGATVTASPTGVTVGAPVLTTSAVRCWLSGGAASVSYTVSCTVVTAQGRTAKRSALLPVASR